ncbi:MAG: hypothetical protein OES38_06020 [Gammaproteobacteria bacterium]|nr:hypothetical protein [Gammaproteobacteria bacterium]
MHRRHQPHYASDGESLQADVMRFMAIIAFCLIAVLALVKNAEPPPEPVAETPELEVEPQVEPQVELAAAPAPAVEEPVLERVRAVKEFEEPLGKPEPVALAPPPSTPIPSTPRPRPPLPAKEKTSEPTIEAAVDTNEEGLSLRFASDRDFLRLVTKGEIQVFAYQARSVLGLDRNFEFLDAESPGQVYELMPETIPGLIFAALDRATGESSLYTWGIRMPKKLEGKIRGFIDRDVHGELVIDRYGEVHHVAS